MVIINVMLTVGHLLSHTKILVKFLPEEVYIPNVPVLTIFHLLHGYQNHGLIRCLLIRLKWVDVSRFYLY